MPQQTCPAVSPFSLLPRSVTPGVIFPTNIFPVRNAYARYCLDLSLDLLLFILTERIACFVVSHNLSLVKHSFAQFGFQLLLMSLYDWWAGSSVKHTVYFLQLSFCSCISLSADSIWCNTGRQKTVISKTSV